MNVLLLAGTGDAIVLAERLADIPDVTTTASFAGRTAHPILPARTNVRIGGFGGGEGLRAYLLTQKIDAVIDATHPFARQMHRNAAAACASLALPIIAFVRPAWTPTAQDRVYEVDDVPAAAAHARLHGRRIFLTIGRQELAPFASCDDRWFLIRSIEAPEAPLPPARLVLLERGPFTLEHELTLMREHAVDLIVSKNSGGKATYAKIEAARALNLPIVMVKRPPRPEARIAEKYDDIIFWTNSLLEKDIFTHEPTRC
jgi:precorrin-6A/cobalt-precorrin-6A reductase